MPEISKKALPSLLDKIAKNSDVRSILINGPDSGAVAELSGNIAAKIKIKFGKNCEVINVDEMQIATDNYLLSKFMLNESLFAAKRIVIVKRAGKVATKAILELGEKIDDNTFLLVEAGSLRKDNQLRKWYGKKTENRCVITLYSDNDADIRLTIKQYLDQNAKDINYSADIIDVISAKCGENRDIAKKELEKLLLYTHNKREITHQDIMTIFSGAEVQTISRLLDTTFNGDLKQFDTAFDSTWSLGTGGIVMINAALKHLTALNATVIASHNNMDKYATLAFIGMQNSPAFWSIERQAKRWSIGALANARTQLHNASIELRNTGVAENAVTHRSFFRILHLAARLT